MKSVLITSAAAAILVSGALSQSWAATKKVVMAQGLDDKATVGVIAPEPKKLMAKNIGECKPGQYWMLTAEGRNTPMRCR